MHQVKKNPAPPKKERDPGWKKNYTVCIQRKPSHLCRKSNGVYKKCR